MTNQNANKKIKDEDIKNAFNSFKRRETKEPKAESDSEEVFNEDSDNPPAGTPGHPGMDDED